MKRGCGKTAFIITIIYIMLILPDLSSICCAENNQVSQGAAVSDKTNQRLLGTWGVTSTSVRMVIVKTLKSDGTFRQSLASYSAISNYAEVTCGKYKISGNKITYYQQTYAKAKGYWKSSAIPGFMELGNIHIEGNLPAADKTESISFKDDNHLIMNGLEWTRVNNATASENKTSANSQNKMLYHNTRYGFTITFPKSWLNKYVVVDSEGSIQIYQKTTYIASAKQMGRLFSIAVFTPQKWKAEGSDITSMTSYYGVKKSSKAVYYFAGPTDVQFDPDNKQAAKEYNAMQKDIPSIVKTFTLDKK